MHRNVFLLLLALAAGSVAVAQTKISGMENCPKPSGPPQMVQVGDRPGHAFMIGKSKCTWPKPMEIGGAQTKEDEGTNFAEVSGNNASDRGYVVMTMSSGDKCFVRYQGKSILKDGALQSYEGTWSFTGGTGKMKGIKGKGTYKGKGAADGSASTEIEGDYQLPK